MKRCSKCQVEKNDADFPRCSRCKHRLDSWCNACRAMAAKLRRLANPEIYRERGRVWRERNAAKYRAEHRRIMREHQRKYREKNIDKCNASTRRWYEKNAERERMKARIRSKEPVRRAYILAAARCHQVSKQRAIPMWADRDAMRAIYVEAATRKARGEDVVVDHIVPLTSRLVCGLHCEQNLRIIQRRENLRKRNYFWPDMPKAA